jgi:hypothetical protein
MTTSNLPCANAERLIRINFNPISQASLPMSIVDPASAQGMFYLALSRVRCPSDVMLFVTEKFPEHVLDFHLKLLD